MKRKFTDGDLIDGLRERNAAAIGHMYEEFFPVVRHYVSQNMGNLQDAQDLVQDAITALYLQVREGPLSLSCTFKTYFVSVSRNLWLQRLDRKWRVSYHPCLEWHEEQAAYRSRDRELEEERQEQERLLHRNMARLPEDCRLLLELYCMRVPYRDIAVMMNYRDEVYVKARKYFCKQILRRRIMNDPESENFFKTDKHEKRRRPGRPVSRKRPG